MAARRVQRVWAFHLGVDHYRIDNAPWFVRDLAVGDVVRAEEPDAGSNPVFVEIVTRSDHVTIRLICFRTGRWREIWRVRWSRSPRSGSTVKGYLGTACSHWNITDRPASGDRVDTTSGCRRRFMGVQKKAGSPGLDRRDQSVVTVVQPC